MKILSKVRRRKLTKINSISSKKTKNNEKIEEFPVLLYCNDRGQTYYVTTGLTTSNPDMKGVIFTDKNRTLQQNSQRTNRLSQMIIECENFYLSHSEESVEFIKDGITKIVRGEVRKKPKVFADFILEFVNDGKHEAGTIKCYTTTYNKVIAFDPNATFESIDSDWLVRFEKWMRQNGMGTNGLAIPMRNIKATFNWAITEKGLTQNYPFKRYKIKTMRTRKTVLTAQDIADFRDFPCEEWQQRYKDMFMLMFYLCGLDISDLCFLGQVKGGRVKFVRHKNRNRDNVVEVDLPVGKEALEILRKYRNSEGVFDFMEGRASYESFNKSMNTALKKIGYSRIVPDKVGKKRKIEYFPILDGLTTKTMRRTFATIAMRLGVPEPVVGMCLGHSWASNNTTQIYEWFDQNDMDKGIRRVIDHVNSLKGRDKDTIIKEIMEREGL